MNEYVWPFNRMPSSYYVGRQGKNIPRYWMSYEEGFNKPLLNVLSVSAILRDIMKAKRNKGSFTVRQMAALNLTKYLLKGDFSNETKAKSWVE